MYTKLYNKKKCRPIFDDVLPRNKRIGEELTRENNVWGIFVPEGSDRVQ